MSVVPIWRALLVGAAVALPAESALAEHEQAPGNLARNPTFDAGTWGWGSFGGRLDVQPGTDPYGEPDPSARVTRVTGSVYTISDTQAGYRPTVASVVAGETYFAFADVRAGSAGAIGKPMRIILRERRPGGLIVRETATAFRIGAGGYVESGRPVVSARILETGNTLDVRVEQSAAVPGDAFLVDDIAVRRGVPFGSTTPGTIWTTMSADSTRISWFCEPGDDSRYMDRVRVYIDGRGGATGSQRLRAVVYPAYSSAGPADGPTASDEVVIPAGMSPRWVDFRFPKPLRLSGYDGEQNWIGLHSGGTGRVARYASTSAPGALAFTSDLYADGPVPGATWQRDDKLISAHGIIAPIGYGGHH